MARSGPAYGQNEEPTKDELQHQLAVSREQLAKTVGEIKETVEEQYLAAKDTITGVLDYRAEFSKEPLVWSLGALSAGFALGYTMGYAHKQSKGSRKQSEVTAFANSLIEELSTVGNNMVMPSLNLKMQKLFGFDFAALLDEIKNDEKGKKTRRANRTPTKRLAAVKKPRAGKLQTRSRAKAGEQTKGGT